MASDTYVFVIHSVTRYMMDNAGIQNDPTLLIFQGAKNADSDSSSW